jgi:hypothetical protein
MKTSGRAASLMLLMLGAAPQWAAGQAAPAKPAPLPHKAQMERSLGGQDARDVEAQPGQPAREATSTVGVEAYATGKDVAFRSGPNTATAAHEAAHVVQQQPGPKPAEQAPPRKGKPANAKPRE